MALACSFAVLLLAVVASCASPTVAKVVQNQLVSSVEIANDVVITDSCGRSAFDAAADKVCLRPKFETMMPIAMLWLNCKYAGAGIEQLSCDGLAANRIRVGSKAFQSCIGALQANQFLQLIHYTMLAFEACEQTALGHSAETLRISVAALVKEAQKSAGLQTKARAFLQDLVERSRDLVEAEGILDEIANDVVDASSTALASSELLRTNLLTAFAASEKNSQHIEGLSEAIEHALRDVADATFLLSEDVDAAIREVEHSAAKQAESIKVELSRAIAALSMAVVIALTIWDPSKWLCNFFVAEMPLSTKVRLPASAICTFTLAVGRSHLFSGPHSGPSFTLAFAFSAGMLVLDLLRFLSYLRRQYSQDQHTVTTLDLSFIQNDSEDDRAFLADFSSVAFGESRRIRTEDMSAGSCASAMSMSISRLS
jgi:hypothetical protein